MNDSTSTSSDADAHAARSAGAIDVDALVDAHGDALFRYALLRVREREAAEDLVQDTLLAAIESRDRFQGQSQPRTWLIGILRHKILDHLRSRDRQQPVSQASGDEEDRSVEALFDKRGMWQKHPGRFAIDSNDLVEKEEFWAALTQCIDELPQRQAQAFTLKSVDEVATGQACEALAVTQSHLWVLLHRARTRLRQCLELSWFQRG